MHLARVAFLLDVVHVSTRGKLAIATDDATAIERGESEEPNKTSHISLRAALKHFLYRSNIGIAATER
jgi:hypothetical protein